MYRHAFGLIATVLISFAAGLVASPARAADCEDDCEIRSHHATSSEQRVQWVSAGIPRIKMTPTIHHAWTPYYVVHTPPVTGFVTREVQVKAARAQYVDVPAVFGTMTREVTVGPARRDGTHIGHHHGHHCFDRHHDKAPVARPVSQRVLLQAPSRILHVTPAVHRTVERPVIMRPAARHVVVPMPLTGGHSGFIAAQRERASWGWYGDRR